MARRRGTEGTDSGFDKKWLATPAGWGRVEILWQMKTPTTNHPWLESCYRELIFRRNSAQYRQTLILRNAILHAPHLGKEGAPSLDDREDLLDFLSNQIPYYDQARRQEEDEMKEDLNEWVKLGPNLEVNVMETQMEASKRHTRTTRAKKIGIKRGTLERKRRG